MALRQVRLVGADAPAVDGIEYVDMPKTPLEALKGKVVLLDFFAHWCKPCIAEFSRLNELQEKYSATDFQILGVTTFYGFIGDQKDVTPAEELVALRALHAQNKLRFGFAISAQTNDGQYGAAGNAYVITMLPTTALIDRAGKVRYLRIGANTSGVEKMIEELLAEPPAKR